MGFIVDKGIPIPLKRGGSTGAKYKYPFNEMEVGDSFLVKCADSEKSRIARNVSGSAHIRDKKFTTRAVKGGVRVWRTA